MEQLYFDVEEGLPADDEAVSLVATVLDEVNTLEETAKNILKDSLIDEKSREYGTVVLRYGVPPG